MTKVKSMIRVLPANVVFAALPGERVVDAVRRAGYRLPYACRRGGCGACLAWLEVGVVDYLSPVADELLEAAHTDRSSGRPCLPCQAVPRGDITIRLEEGCRLVRIFGGGTDFAADDGAAGD
ncbi:CDP-4-dehydro-6-deoxyglucose reductase [Nocardia kruczakiae]|uniref:CDP-4-dehydro-6-deoxyglucose reductase n=1 Tax=Nocardia kruczakiae TaxID=261477 RepID=A0ABU1XR59_9NOCA|nr:2Fe-2S iron-sulfur cluster-binding protein [Nocardia kruczakiae]MDR7173053.1 CDP-4-dehydro-6-deoxyglucose reductase [Nocardia kruczakiae]